MEPVGKLEQLEAGGMTGGQTAGQQGLPDLSGDMTSAMVKHFANELTRDSLSLWPQFVQSTRRYFNVTHSYVLRKALWELAPLARVKAKPSSDAELGEKEGALGWLRDGTEVNLEEPDLYIPTMGFVTYLLLTGLILGLQEQFKADTFSTTFTFCMVVLVMETVAVKVALVMTGAENAPFFDVMALLGYKYLHISLQLILGLLLGWGHRPGKVHHLLSLGLAASYGLALWQTLLRLARMQPLPQASPELHKLATKAIPAAQMLVWWLLLPSWPKAVHVAAAVAPELVTSAPVASSTAAAVAAAVQAAATTLAANATAGVPH